MKTGVFRNTMIRKYDDRPRVEKQSHGGDGTVMMTSILNGQEELHGIGSFFSVITVPPGCSLGWHTHMGECEAALVITGCGECFDGDKTEAFTPGDVLLAPDKSGHAVRNTGTDPVELVVLVYYT